MSTTPRRKIDIFQGFLHPLVDLASHVTLKKSVFIVNDDVSEALRWNGGIRFLLRDFGVSNIVSFSTVLSMKSSKDIQSLTNNFGLDSIFDDVSSCNGIFVLSGYLWDYQVAFEEIITRGGFDEITICSTLSEEAHINSSSFNTSYKGKLNFLSFQEHLINYSINLTTKRNASTCISNEISKDKRIEINIRHLPLHASPFFSGKTTKSLATFVLTNSICSQAFPLMLSHLSIDKEDINSLQDLPPEAIPTQIRQSYKLIAHVLGDIIMQLGLEVKEHIFAAGSTSIRVGHSLLNVLENLQEELTTLEINELKPGSVILFDRTLDLMTPTSHSDSLLELILDSLPKMENPQNITTTKKNLMINEIYPLHLCEPLPYDSLNTLISSSSSTTSKSFYECSSFISSINWKGGCTLVTQEDPIAFSLYENLFFTSALLSLKSLDKELRKIVAQVIKLTNCSKPNRLPTDRGRDVILKYMKTITEYSPEISYKYRNLLQLGLTLLETLTRSTERSFSYDAFNEKELRMYQLYKQHAQEWILPELADLIKNLLEKKLLQFKDILSLGIHAYALSGEDGFDEFTSVKLFSDALLEKIFELKTEEEISALTFLSTESRVDLLAQIERESKNLSLPLSSSSPPPSYLDSQEVEDEWSWTEKSSQIDETEDKDDTENDPLLDKLQLKLAIEDELQPLLDILKECGTVRKDLKELGKFTLSENRVMSTLGQLCLTLLDPLRPEISILKNIIDASEQITRAGIDLLKSGFSHFGLSRGAFSGASQIHPLNTNTILIFVIGGISIKEIQQLNEIFGERNDLQVIIGSTCVVTGEVILNQVFPQR